MFSSSLRILRWGQYHCCESNPPRFATSQRHSDAPGRLCQNLLEMWDKKTCLHCSAVILNDSLMLKS